MTLLQQVLLVGHSERGPGVVHVQQCDVMTQGQGRGCVVMTQQVLHVGAQVCGIPGTSDDQKARAGLVYEMPGLALAEDEPELVDQAGLQL